MINQKKPTTDPVVDRRFRLPNPLFIILALTVFIGFLAVILWLFMGKFGNLIGQRRSWCQKGDKIISKNNTLSIVGREDYKTQKLGSKVCHLILEQNDLTTDYYVDEVALSSLQGNNLKDVGNGCVVYKIKNTKDSTEFCFGKDIKNDIQKLDEKSFLSPTAVLLAPSETKQFNFTGNTWRYMIQVGGGVGGVMKFDKDENNVVSGTYEENGPEGKVEKKFNGYWDKGVLMLSLGDFPQFTVSLSVDGKTLLGKPTQMDKDIYYPDDFFRATLEP